MRDNDETGMLPSDWLAAGVSVLDWHLSSRHVKHSGALLQLEGARKERGIAPSPDEPTAPGSLLIGRNTRAELGRRTAAGLIGRPPLQTAGLLGPRQTRWIDVFTEYRELCINMIGPRETRDTPFY